MNRISLCWLIVSATLLAHLNSVSIVRAEGDWEITAESQEALRRGLKWLAANQGTEGNWTSNDLGLVSTGALAFLAAGQLPGRGQEGEPTRLALEFVVNHAKPSGLLNMSNERRDMYNHGLATFVLGQAYGMSNDPDIDSKIGPVLDRALKLIAQTQCKDGGWDYVARPQARGHDLSLAVMQAKALRSAVDSGLEVPPEVIELAIQSVREHYHPKGCAHNASEEELRKHPGQFTYNKGGGQGTLAMAAAGVVCLQEFAQYDDWRIEKNMEVVSKAIREKADPKKFSGKGKTPFDAYTLYYVGQALYQVGGDYWKEDYPLLRDTLVKGQGPDGLWQANGRVNGAPGNLYMTAVACFVLGMPNRYLPILQEGKIESLRKRQAK